MCFLVFLLTFGAKATKDTNHIEDDLGALAREVKELRMEIENLINILTKKEIQRMKFSGKKNALLRSLLSNEYDGFDARQIRYPENIISIAGSASHIPEIIKYRRPKQKTNEKEIEDSTFWWPIKDNAGLQSKKGTSIIDHLKEPSKYNTTKAGSVSRPGGKNKTL